MSKIVGKLLQPVWRMTRGLTLGAQGIVRRVEEDGDQVLLVRHGYRSGWHFPGGGVEWKEPVEVAMKRELEEETGVIVDGPVRLHGVFSNASSFPGDHILIYVVDHWNQPQVPSPNAEIREQRFFTVNALPSDLADGARRRINELYFGEPTRLEW